MREIPIIFKGDMVRAILDGKKTQTRRPIKPQPDDIQKRPDGTWERRNYVWFPLIKFDCGDRYYYGSPIGAPGDRLWVRETFKYDDTLRGGGIPRLGISYLDGVIWKCGCPIQQGPWRPSIHMPRWASRITLIVKRVWVERVQDITIENIIAEGFVSMLREHDACVDLKNQFFKTWDSIYGKTFPVESNPWVWCAEFERDER